MIQHNNSQESIVVPDFQLAFQGNDNRSTYVFSSQDEDMLDCDGQQNKQTNMDYDCVVEGGCDCEPRNQEQSAFEELDGRTEELEGKLCSSPRVCIWGGDHFSLKYFWEALQARLGQSLVAQIIKINRISQKKDGKIHFDVFCPSTGLAQQVIRAALRLRCMAKIHQPWLLRSVNNINSGNRDGGEAPPSSVCANLPCVEDKRPGVPHITDRLKIISWNIRSINMKCGETELLIAQTDPDVLCIQETWWSANGWALAFPGYRVLEARMPEGGVEQGKLGLALAVKKYFSMVMISDPDPNFIFAEVTGGKDGSTVVVGCVYLPGKGKARTGALQRLICQIRILEEASGSIPDSPLHYHWGLELLSS